MNIRTLSFAAFDRRAGFERVLRQKPNNPPTMLLKLPEVRGAKSNC